MPPPPPDPPPLPDRAIRALVGQRAYDRAHDYLAAGALSHLRRAGRILEARVRGTASRPYAVSARIDRDGRLDTADCACPVGTGACKHVAALLLAYLRDPNAFTAADQLDQRLKSLDKPRLVALLKQAVRRHPELESLLDTVPPPPGKRGKRTPVTPDPFRRQADAAFDDAPDEYNYTGHVAAQLRAIAESADEFTALGDHASAAAVHRGVLQSVLNHEYALNDDEPGHLFTVVHTACQSLARCLQHLPNPTDREPILRALFNVLLTDLQMGGTTLGDEATATLCDQTTPQDKQLITPWIRDAQSRADGWAHDALTDLLDEFE